MKNGNIKGYKRLETDTHFFRDTLYNQKESR